MLQSQPVVIRKSQRIVNWVRSNFRRILIELAFAVASVFVFFIFDKNALLKDTSQIYYLSSTGAQALASLFGIVVTGFIFFRDRLNQNKEISERNYDAISYLEKRTHKKILEMSIYFVITIILCVLCMVLCPSDSATLYSLNVPLILLIYFFLRDNVFILAFVYNVTDPNRLNKAFDAFVLHMQDGTIRNQTNAFTEFISLYNQLEELIITTAMRLNNGEEEIQKGKRPLILQAMNTLLINEVLDKKILDEVDVIRKYRNAAVHSAEPFASESKRKQVQDLIDKVRTNISL